MRCSSAMLVVFGLLGLTAEARAHGCYPEANQLAFHPDTGELALVRVTNVLILHDDDGRWRWQCTEALDWRGSRQRCTTPVAWMSDGTLLSSSILSGMARSVDTGCEWTFDDIDAEADESTRMVVIDQAPHPQDRSAMFAVSSRGGSQDNRVYFTEDNGASWEPTGPFIDPILFESIAVAPSDPDRVYLTGAIPPTSETPREAFVYRSADGGGSWESFGFELQDNERNIYLMEVDPQDPDHLFMYVLPDSQEQMYLKDFRVVRSTNGGETWSDALDVPLLGGMAFAPDGQTVWIGQNDASRGEGALWRSDDGGESFAPVPEVTHLVSCVHHHDGALWICANHWRDGFVVGRSTDGGDSFEGVFGFEDVHDMLPCPEGSHGRQSCDPWRCDINNELFGGEPEIGDDGTLIEADCPGNGADAGTGPDGGSTGSDDGGCGCATVGTRAHAKPALALLLLALSALLLRRRPLP
jgi:MYXO-CTERM domain-containing protein